jgi:hypothetical protein
MNTVHYYELIDVTGPLPSKVNGYIEDTLKLLPADHPARKPLLEAAFWNSKMGQRIQDLRDWGAESFGDPARGIAAPGEQKQPSGLKPGQRIADVSEAEGAYTGPLDPDTLTPGNWRYWGEHNNLHARTGQIFSKAPTVMDPATGKLLTMGDYANAAPDGTPFAPFE